MKNRSCSSSPTSSDDASSAIVLLASASSESEAPSAASARSSSDRRGSTRPRRRAPVTSMLIAVVEVPAASSIEPRSRWQLASSTGSSTSGSAASISRAACGRSPVSHASDAASASRRPFSCGDGDSSAARSAAADAAVNAFRDRARPAACSSSAGHLLVRFERCRGEVPRIPVDLTRILQRLCERAMDRATLGERRGSIDRRADKRMPEADLRRLHADQPGLLCAVKCREI